jgi:L-lactate dehydrogenase complex protein LldG
MNLAPERHAYDSGRTKGEGGIAWAIRPTLIFMLTLTHFILVCENELVPTLNDAAGILLRQTGAGSDQRHYISFVTGPSRTADIERTLTIGVQGSKT